MKKTLLSAIILAGSLAAGHVSALGLGDISVKSAVNEHLDAEIALLNARGLDSSQILINLGSAADFERAGVERGYFLTSLKFDVERLANGRSVLRVTSPDVVLEPYLNFVIEARWPAGRLLREYTLLLDLPQFSAAPLKAINRPDPRPQNRSPVTSAQSTPATARSAAAPVRPAPSVTASEDRAGGASTSGEWVVQANESLSKIAQQVRPNGSSLQQTMLALKALNPQAFIDNNINLLRRGAVLRLPSEADVASQDNGAARAQVQREHNDWVAGGSTATPALRTGVDARQSAGSSDGATASADGHLQLAARVDAATANVANASSDTATQASVDASQSVQQSAGNAAANSAEVEYLRNELAVSLESLDKSSLENSEMSDRLQAMESQLSDLERLVSLKDEEVQAVRLALEARRQDLQASEQAAAVELAEAESLAQESTSQSAEMQDAVGTLVDTAPEPVQSAPAAAAPQQAKGFLAGIAASLGVGVEMLLAGLVGGVLLVVALFFALVTRSKDDYEATVFEEQQSSSDPAIAEPQQLSEESVAEVEPVAESGSGAEPAADEASGSRADAVRDDAEVSDPLAEADIYLAYGRHEQAAAMLSVAIASEPARHDLQLKLLEVFVESDQPAAFRDHCEPMLANADAQFESDARALLQGRDDVSAWWPGADVTAVADTAAEPAGIDEALGLDLDLPSTDTAAATADAADVDDAEFELQLAYDADTAEADAAELDAEPVVESGQDGLSADDEVGTKLDLARAYIDMGDFDGAREILDEVLLEGDSEQQGLATEMKQRMA